MKTAAEDWLERQLRQIVFQAREFGLPVELSYQMTFEEGGRYVMLIRPEYWNEPAGKEQAR